MARRRRNPGEQSEHDRVIDKLADVYAARGFVAWMNAGSEKHASVNGKWPDVVVVADQDEDDEVGRARFAFDGVVIVFEVETASSVNATEAAHQWAAYDEVFDKWYLIVPVDFIERAEDLVDELGLSNVVVASWSRARSGRIRFGGLP